MFYLCEVKNMITDDPIENYLCIVDPGEKMSYNFTTFAKVILAYRFACCR